MVGSGGIDIKNGRMQGLVELKMIRFGVDDLTEYIGYSVVVLCFCKGLDLKDIV